MSALVLKKAPVWTTWLRAALVVLLLGGIMVATTGCGSGYATNCSDLGCVQGNAGRLFYDLQIWVWIMAGIGLLLWLAAFFFQPVLPSWYGSMKDYFRNAMILMVVVGIVISFIANNIKNGVKYTVT